MSAPLAVILDGRVIGHLDRSSTNNLRFTYLDDATGTGRTPLSLSMPLAGGSFTGPPVERFLRGLLPESDAALTAIERGHPGTDRLDPLSVLAVIGQDCPGAVQFCRPPDAAAVVARTGALVPQSAGQIEQRIAVMRVDEGASWSMPDEHWSLGGTQPKFALRRIGDDWYEAHGSEPTSHILKPGVHGMKAQSLVEHISMRAAAACGVDVARTEHPSFKSETAIVITRFDRVERDGTLVRLHQEDLCQALGVAQKYQEYGGPGASDIIRLLREQSPTARTARANVDRFVDGLILNTVIAAPDAHARNYAVLLAGHDVRLAPLFDVSTSLPYDPTSRGHTLSMSVDGQYIAELVTREHWSRFAAENDLDAERVVERAQQMADIAPPAMLAALDEVEDWDGSAAMLRERLTAALEVYLPTLHANLTGSRD
ncbi:type II toxin-antitoxin system HipA family toxin [Cellulomonas xiejunii]|uniref:type II toxin-antitoxin system HipA family toxin n=1 Tax=Cellulomonas xiejunii TaxID=2968083 RepID=UPI001D0EA00B|nr:type II toxin-antitoxin system HipA family toxin [Cellulomonas xiejunii]MCC2313994.1 type II toxin-antitoxin system HipA family toxin [Cellulomonas xiejunii]